MTSGAGSQSSQRLRRGGLITSEPAHFNEVHICGRVEAFYRAATGRIAAVMLQVHVDEAALIPVVAKDMPRVQRGQKLFVKGVLATMPDSGQRYPLLCIVARTIEVLKPARPQGEGH